MKRNILLYSLLLIFLSTSAQFIEDESTEDSTSQNEEAKFSDKLFFGGNLGLMFGSVTNVNISPTVGYRITPELGVGIGPIYEFYSDKREYVTHFSTSIYGGKIFAQSLLFETVILYFENNLISLENKHFNNSQNAPETGRYLTNVPWIGGGYYQVIGNGGVFAMVLFNLNQNRNSPYPPYEIRLGINF